MTSTPADADRRTYLATDPGSRTQRRIAAHVVDVVVVAACVVFVLWHLQPELLLRNTTPAGGDMGAHVWGPAYLRDHLLPNGQLAGWTPDWYAGFPAYQFYMVVPSLLIVLLNAGLARRRGVRPRRGGLVRARRGGDVLVASAGAATWPSPGPSWPSRWSACPTAWRSSW